MRGFSNPGILAVMVSGMEAMVTERRDDIVALGIHSVMAKTPDTFMTGAEAGIFM